VVLLMLVPSPSPPSHASAGSPGMIIDDAELEATAVLTPSTSGVAAAADVVAMPIARTARPRTAKRRVEFIMFSRLRG
jgi:hypothetical protein